MRSICPSRFLTPAIGLLSAAAMAQPVPLCHYVPATSTTGDTVVFETVGGLFASYGCAPIDPTFWLAGSGVSITAQFIQPADHPAIRVWGMNDDDVASVSVNGSAYALNDISASLAPKVVCGISPGPDGVLFSGGNLVGANSNTDGNYSYQDVTLNTTGVNSITVAGVQGAGWGFAGVLLDCATGVTQINAQRGLVFPIIADGLLQLPASANFLQVVVLDSRGTIVERSTGSTTSIDLRNLSAGCYTIILFRGSERTVHRVVKL